MFRTILVAALLVPLALVPNAAAHECPTHVEDAIAVGDLYVSQTPGVYQESNGIAGLQDRPGSCTDDNGRDYEWIADTKIL